LFKFSKESSRTHKDRRIQKRCKVYRGRQTHHIGIRNQCGSLIVICCEPSDHFGDSEFVSPECKPKFMVILTPKSRKELLSEGFQNSGFRSVRGTVVGGLFKSQKLRRRIGGEIPHQR
jgi:hypothetical protein